MRIVVSAPTRFHLFDLARELARRRVLGRLFTTYPRTCVDPHLRALTTSLPVYGLLGYAVARMRDGHLRRGLEWQFIERYDRAVARRLPEADVVVGLSGRALHTLCRARVMGAVAVCDRGSSHIVYQDQVLAEEHARWAVPYRPIDRRGIAKELAEYEAADLITVPSRYARTTFEAHGVPADKIAVIPYGVDIDQFRPGPGSGDRFRVLFAGRIGLRKGVPYLLEAVRPLVSLPKFEVWLAGAMEPEARRWLGRFQGFRLLGHLSRAALARVYGVSSVFVHPSVEEGLGLVIAQAMASQLPVIASSATGAEELVTDGKEGFIVPPRSPEAIRDRLLELYEDPDLRSKMGAAALDRVRQGRGWAQYGRQALDAYMRLCRGCG
ncbi:MAG: glycosyltransferase family 4 protein [Armatimonadota bacterium]|nr:glycosyltransferase family 4 protein [Armatimonadota bacterium]